MKHFFITSLMFDAFCNTLCITNEPWTNLDQANGL